MKIVLISCASKKAPIKENEKIKAEKLYISQLFKSNLKYAKSLNPDKIFILSAKYGLVDLEQEIETYEKTLNIMPDDEVKKWAGGVLEDLKQKANIDEDEFIFLAGEKYRKHLILRIKNYLVPMKGLGIGKQLRFLKDKNKENFCAKLHILFNHAERHKFPFEDRNIPKNGIYLLFEKGELAHGGDRIVRVGTHNGENQLISRLKQHFLKENKDRSIFRKNIGRAILNKEGDDFLEKWEIDLTTKEAKENFSSSINFEKQKEIEKQVSKHIQDNFTFVVFRVEDVQKRLKLESKIISTISLCEECFPSENWFGLHSPKEKIKKSGLWLVNELYKEPLTYDDFAELKNLTKKL